MTIEEQQEPLLLDRLTERLDSFQLFRVTDPLAASAVLESLGTEGAVEAEMVAESASLEPIAHPDRFEEAHRRVMRALEVYDRNGPRKSAVSVPPALKRPAAFGVQFCTRAIVRKYQRTITAEIRQLYALREASAANGSPQHRMLRLAREQVDRIRADLNKNPLPLPAFIGVSAALSSILSLVRKGATDDLGRVLVLVAFIVIGLASFWCVVKGAGIARRRTRIALDAPLEALWEVLGDAGALPRDKSRVWAINATVILVAVWVVVPIVIALAVNMLGVPRFT